MSIHDLFANQWTEKRAELAARNAPEVDYLEAGLHHDHIKQIVYDMDKKIIADLRMLAETTKDLK